MPDLNFSCPLFKSREGGGTTYSGLYGEALSKRGSFFKLAVY